jgi:hypothetical protein
MATRYTREQLEAELARPKKKGGRPKKYHTEEERKRANAEYAQRHYHRQHDGPSAMADDDIAPRKKTYQTDEERKEGRRESRRKYTESHIEQCRLSVAACGYQVRHS